MAAAVSSGRRGQALVAVEHRCQERVPVCGRSLQTGSGTIGGRDALAKCIRGHGMAARGTCATRRRAENSMSCELLSHAQTVEEPNRIANEIARPAPNGANHSRYRE